MFVPRVRHDEVIGANAPTKGYLSHGVASVAKGDYFHTQAFLRQITLPTGGTKLESLL